MSVETQLAHLREKLLGNNAFRACRGKLNRPVTDMITDFVAKTGNPTQFCQTWDDMTAAMRIMGNLLAQYSRDGWTAAHNELLLALKGKHVIMGEVVPFEETVPVTIVMFDPDRTLHMIQWIDLGHWMDLDAKLDEIDGKGKDDTDRRGLAKELFAKFPTLEKHTRKRRSAGDYEGWDVCQALQDEVIDKFKVPKDWIELPLTFGQYNDHLEIRQQTFAYLVVGEDQSAVLSRFSREEQKLVATWMLNIPRALLVPDDAYNHLMIGFHEESEHDTQKRRHPAMTSKGVSSGFGIRLIDQRALSPGYHQQADPYIYGSATKCSKDKVFRFALDLAIRRVKLE